MSFWSYLKFWNSKKRNAENRGDQQLVTSSSATQIQQRVGEKRDNGNGGLHVESGVSEPKKPRMSSEEEIRNYNAVKKPNGAVSAERMSVDTTEEDDEDLVLLGFHSGTSSANTSNLISESPKSQEEPVSWKPTALLHRPLFYPPSPISP
ncbi:hypothetical protein L596_018346 [Steinernema carpocapsae]|uniref:Uncharacterized protein n=1 Tax=Steinernema carpocapsae TaxID=34508 RepID=A0A4U5N528_STECR|nr:hypothetical protein L596_018346 [Steinernema carpocapsae]